MGGGGRSILPWPLPCSSPCCSPAPGRVPCRRVAPEDGRLISDNKVDLEPGQRATLHLVAPDTPNSHYEFRSTNLADAAEKLKGDILVR